MPPKDSTPILFKDTSSMKIMNRQVAVSDYKKAISPLLSIMPELERTLPSTGTVFVGNSAYPEVTKATVLANGLQSLKLINRKYFDLIRDDLIKEKLDDIYIDENGNVHHTGPDSSTTTTPAEEEPTIDPAIEELKNQGRQFSRQLINLPWFTYTMPMAGYTISSINLDNDITEQLHTVMNNADMRTGFYEGLWISSNDPSYENSSRWRNVFFRLGTQIVTSKINEAIAFGPFTGLSATEINGVPFLSKRTDNDKVINRLEQISQGLTDGLQPTDDEKDVTAGSAVSALLNADWDHDFFLTKINMTHDQAQLFGKGCKFLGPWLIEQGRKLQQNSSGSESDSDSATAQQIVGTILVVCGNILQYLGQQILNCDKGRGIRLLTNFWAGFLLTGLPIIWPQSR